MCPLSELDVMKLEDIDALGSTAFAPVKADLTGNVNVRVCFIRIQRHIVLRILTNSLSSSCPFTK